MSRSTKDLRKAAVLLVTLPDQTASLILEKLDRVTAKKITRQIQEMGEIRPDERAQAMADFLNEVLADQVDRASKLVTKWCNPDSELKFPRFSF